MLYKLGQSFIEKNKIQLNSQEAASLTQSQSTPDDVLEVTSEITYTNQNGSWTQEKLRGFKKKTSPSSVDEGPRLVQLSDSNNRDNEASNDREELPKKVQISDKQIGFTEVNNKNKEESQRICHYYASTGRCNFEDRTGLKCKFAHMPIGGPRSRPMCQMGINCSRPGCTFSHPRINTMWREPGRFLGNWNAIINPWQNQMEGSAQMNPNQWPPQSFQNMQNWNMQNMQQNQILRRN